MQPAMKQNISSSASRPAPPPVSGFFKKGLGCCNPATTPAELGQLNLGWYYNWRPFPIIPPVPGVEFVPMFWCGKDVTPGNLAAVRQSAATHVLGFNEPDMDGQSGMTPGECLELWPQLMTLPQRLGSPAPADWKWLDQFIPESKRRGLRVDFVCLHRYPDISNPAAVTEVIQMIEAAHRKYALPVWLTESGAADVSAWRAPQQSKPTPGMAQHFLQQLLPILERLPFVERYAWFADRAANEYSLGSMFDLNASRLTALGKLYRDGAREGLPLTATRSVR
jgi:hypothetical protein